MEHPTYWIPEQKLFELHTVLGDICQFKNLTLVTWPWLELHFGFTKWPIIALNTCVTLLKCDLWLSWPLVTWHWPWTLLSMDPLSMQYLHHTLRALWPSLGQDTLNAASPGRQKWKHYILTFDLTLTWHVTFKEKKKKKKNSICETFPTPSRQSLSLRPSVRETAGGGTETAQAVRFRDKQLLGIPDGSYQMR